MARFLTEEWTKDVVRAANGSDAARSALAGAAITIQQVVTGTPSGDTKYWTKLSDGQLDVALGDASDPDVTITQDYETAVAINRGDLVPQAAFMQGKLKISGNMGKMLKSQDAVSAVAPVLARVPTDY